jgi:hypothetical protein
MPRVMDLPILVWIVGYAMLAFVSVSMHLAVMMIDCPVGNSPF